MSLAFRFLRDGYYETRKAETKILVFGNKESKVELRLARPGNYTTFTPICKAHGL